MAVLKYTVLKYTVMNCLVASTALLLAAGCGMGDSASGAGQAGNAAGRLELVSVQPVHLQEVQPNLIPNGDFALWWAGAPAPQHFQTPAKDLSYMTRVPGAGASPFAALQEWRASDATTGLTKQFGVEAEVEGGVRYILTVDAERLLPNTITIWVWEFDADGKPEPVDSPFLSLGPSQGIYKRYVRPFTPKKSGPVFISSRADGPSRVIWHEWRLMRDLDQE